MQLSIIIPVYNVESFIEECLNPLTKLKNDKIEVIIVDDESPDNSMRVIENFIPLIQNLKIIRQKNKGLSGARNTGLNHSTGQYVFFYDSDDFIEPTLFQSFLERAIEGNYDICCGDGSIFENGNLKIIKQNTFRKRAKAISGTDYFKLIVTKKEFSPMVWLNLYRREFLLHNKISFSEGIIHEDEEFTAKCLALAQTVKYFPINFYRYRYREGSISKNCGHKYYNPKSMKSFFTIINNLYQLTNGSTKERREIYLGTITKCYLEIIRRLHFLKKNKYLELQFNWRDITSSTIFQSLPLSYKVKIYRLMLKNLFQ